MDINDIILSNIDIILITCKKISENDFFLPVVFPEFLGRAALLLLEDAVEVGQVVEPALVANLGDGHGGIDQHAGCVADADVDDIVGQGLPGAQLEEAAERSGGHADHFGHLFQTDFLLVVGIDVFLDLLDSAAVEYRFDLGEGGTGEGACLFHVERQFVQDGEELDEGIEPLFLCQRVELVVHFHDGSHGEAQSVLRLGKHLLNGFQLVLVDE